MSDYKQLLEKLKSKRNNLDNYWQQVANYCLPRRDFTTKRNEGQNRHVDLYDDLGVLSVEALASALSSMLTPEKTQWIKLHSPNASEPLKRWLATASNIVFQEFSVPSRRLYQSLHETYLDMAAFGNGCLFVNGRDGLSFQSLSLRDCWINENDKGVIDTLVHESKISKRDMIEKFGEDNLHRNVLSSKDMDKKWKVLHVVKPRMDNYGKGAKADKKPFESCYYDCENDHKIEESGFDTFPFVFFRFQKRSSEIYGYGPGMTALSTIKMRNQIMEIMIRGGAKAVDPVTLSPAEGLLGQNRMDPGDILFYDPTVGKPEAYNTNYRPDYFEYLLEKSRYGVERIFYTDWLNLPRQSNMTATEVMQRTQESLRMLSPMLARVHNDLTNLVMRSFAVLMDEGVIPELPEDIVLEDIKVDFVSPMDQAQRMTNAQSVLQGLGFMSQLAQFDQTVVDDVKFSDLLRDTLLENYNFEPKHLTSQEEKAEIQEARQEQSQMQDLMMGSEAAKNAASAVKDLNEQ